MPEEDETEGMEGCQMMDCVNCKHVGRPTYKYPCSECKGCRKHEPVEIRTNGDRIRAMSDEELAEFLSRVKKPCGYCQLSAVAGACTETLCDDAMEEWLKQPVEEGADG